MMTRFRVKNYKCLKDVDIRLTPIHVLIGQNDSGKTSLLEAMYALFRANEFDVTIPDAFPGDWTADELVHHGSPEARVELGAEFYRPRDKAAVHRYELAVLFHPFGRRAQAWSETINAQALSYQGETAESVVKSRLRHSDLLGPTMELLDELRGVELFRLNPRIMALPNEIDLTNAKNADAFRLDRDGFGLARLLDEILSYDFELFGQLRDSFREFFPQYVNIRLEKRPEAFSRVAHPAIDHLTMAPGKEVTLVTADGPIRLRHASDGAILLLGFLAICHVPQPPRLILIEEPENGIYPKRLGEVVRLLKTFATSGRPNAPQIILTTHSPYLLSEFEPEEVTVMCRQADGSVRARPLRDAPRIKERLGEDFAYLGELWYNYDEEALFGDAQPAPSH